VPVALRVYITPGRKPRLVRVTTRRGPGFLAFLGGGLTSISSNNFSKCCGPTELLRPFQPSAAAPQAARARCPAFAAKLSSTRLLYYQEAVRGQAQGGAVGGERGALEAADLCVSMRHAGYARNSAGYGKLPRVHNGHPPGLGV
jgi:hypothetical protein